MATLSICPLLSDASTLSFPVPVALSVLSNSHDSEAIGHEYCRPICEKSMLSRRKLGETRQVEVK